MTHLVDAKCEDCFDLSCISVCPVSCFQDAKIRKGAAVAEVTDLADMSGWPDGTRLIVRGQPLHPGAQGSLFPSVMFRY